jgi:hypothetical protein
VWGVWLGEGDTFYTEDKERIQCMHCG